MSDIVNVKRRKRKKFTNHTRTWWDRHDSMINKRRESTIIVQDFPLVIRTKPTSHPQYCVACRMPINKGQLQIKMDAGLWHTDNCKGEKRQFRAVFDRVKVYHTAKSYDTKDWTETFYPRHVYLHINCLSCLLKKMFSKVGIPLSPNCDECGMRFNCYTNNINMDESQPTYVPSHPCSREDNWMKK